MNAFRARCGAGERDFLVGYVGNFGFKQQMEIVVESARLLRDRRDVRFAFVGDGAQKHEAVALAKDAHLENIEFLGVQPREALPDMLAAMDLHILHQRREVIDMVVPSKLLTYAASGRPILFAGVSESEGAKFIVNAGAGTVIEPEDPELLAEAVVTLKANPGEREQQARNGRSFVEENFHRDGVLARAEALLIDVAGQHKQFARLPEWEHR